MAGFFINVDTGAVATHRQLIEAGEAPPADEPPSLPWHPVQGPSDASTASTAVLRKRVQGRERECLDRHARVFATASRQAFLEAARAGRRSRGDPGP